MDPLDNTPTSQGHPFPISMTVPPGLSGPGSDPSPSSGSMPSSSTLSGPPLHHQHQYGHQQQQIGGPGVTHPGMSMPPPPQIPPQAQSHLHGLSSMSQAMSEHSVVKLTRGHSCVLCQQRKVRCDKNKPCANCVKAQVECRVIPPQPPRRRKKKPQERELVDRLRKYESLLSQHGVNFDPIAHEYKHGDQGSSTIDELEELQHDLGGLKTSPSSSNHDYTSEPGGPSKQSSYKDYRSNDETLRDSSDDEVESSTIHHAFDSMFDDQDGFPFVVGGSAMRVTEHHPPGIQIFQLWQMYLTNANPLLKITHTPSLQAQIIEAGTNVSKIPRPLEALMFSIYFMAITTMTEADVQSAFGEDKARLLNKFHRASQQALVNAGFMRSPDIMVLQAYFLYLLCVRQYVDPRSLFCLIGIAVRMAQGLGLHRDGEQFGLPPFEVELRRRLWWQIVIFDKRIAEMTGSVITALSSSNGDTKFPLNINDTDLHVDAKDPPTPYAGPTEMLFCLTRIEMFAPRGSPDSQAPSSSAADTSGNTHTDSSPNANNAPSSAGGGITSNSAASSGPSTAASGVVAAARKIHYSPNPVAPDVATHVAHHSLPNDTDSYCRYIENKYLKTCDTKIPLHFFTLMMTRQALAKMRMLNLLVRSAKSSASSATGSGSSPSESTSGGHPASSTGAGGMKGGMGMGGMMGGGMGGMSGMGGMMGLGLGGGMMGGGMMGGGMMGGMMGGGGGGGSGMMGMGMGMGEPGLGPGLGPDMAATPSDSGSAGHTGSNLAPNMDDAEHDAMFLEAINVVEYDNIVQGAQNLRGLLWYTILHFPLPAYMVVVMELRSRHTGDLVERAWTAICENHERRGLAQKLRNPVHVSFGAQFIKAWDARAAAEMQNGHSLKTPKFIQLLRATLHKINPAAAAALAASQQARQASGQPASGDQVPVQRPLPQVSTGAGHQQQQQQQQQYQRQQQQQRHLGRSLEEGIVMTESPPQHQQHHQTMTAQGPHPSAASSSTSSPPAAQHSQQHHPMVYAAPTPPPPLQQQQQQQQIHSHHHHQHQQQHAAGQSGAFDGMVPVQPMGIGLPDMMDMSDPANWGLFMQGQYGSGFSNGGEEQDQGQGQGPGGPGGQGGPDGSFGGEGYGSMYGHGG